MLGCPWQCSLTGHHWLMEMEKLGPKLVLMSWLQKGYIYSKAEDIRILYNSIAERGFCPTQDFFGVSYLFQYIALFQWQVSRTRLQRHIMFVLDANSMERRVWGFLYGNNKVYIRYTCQLLRRKTLSGWLIIITSASECQVHAQSVKYRTSLMLLL